MKKLSFVLIFTLISSFLIISLSFLKSMQVVENYAKKEIEFSFNVSGCLKERRMKTIHDFEKLLYDFNYEFSNNSLSFSHKLSYVCCAKIILEAEIDEKNKEIIIKERNIGEICKCICNYEINGTIKNLKKGSYKLKIYGIYFEDQKGQLMLEKEILEKKVGEYYGFSTFAKCNSSKDCRIGGCNREICQGINEELVSICILPKKPTPLALGYKCICINNKCQWHK